jgi:hypothetical protein
MLSDNETRAIEETRSRRNAVITCSSIEHELGVVFTKTNADVHVAYNLLNYDPPWHIEDNQIDTTMLSPPPLKGDFDASIKILFPVYLITESFQIMSQKKYYNHNR